MIIVMPLEKGVHDIMISIYWLVPMVINATVRWILLFTLVNAYRKSSILGRAQKEGVKTCANRCRPYTANQYIGKQSIKATTA